MTNACANPTGLCMCGCGGKTKLATGTDSRKGWVKGKPIKYIRGHQSLKSPLTYLVDEVTGCWVWQRGCTGSGYGHWRQGGVDVLAHRWYYEQKHGPIPEGLHIDHLCRNPACVNPDHLEPVTPRENTLRGIGRSAVNVRKTHCIRGHRFSEDNTYIDPSGGRQCRICQRIRWRASRARRAESARRHP